MTDELTTRASALVTAALAAGTQRNKVMAALDELERALSTQSAPITHAGLHCFLVFDPSGGGKLISQWDESGTAIDGALACFVPKKTVPKWKITANAGRTEVINDCGNGGISAFGRKKRFFEGWTMFVKEARGYQGTLTHLGNVPDQAIGLYLNLYDTLDVVRVTLGTPVDLMEARAVACVSGQAAGYSSKLEGCSKLEHRLFLEYGHNDGASLDFLPRQKDSTKFRDPGPSPRKQGLTHAPGLPPAPTTKGVPEKVIGSIGGRPKQEMADAALAERQHAKGVVE